MSALSSAVHVVLGLGAFLTVAASVGAVRPGPSDFEITDKLNHLRRHPDRYDAIIIGSSLVYRHFLPEVIDERMAARGHPMRTFNVGCPGMLGHETAHVLQEVLELVGDRVRYVFLEPGRFSTTLFDENRRAARTVAWHSGDRTAAVLRQILARDEPLEDRLPLLTEHLTIWAWNLANYGEGPRSFLSWVGMGAAPQLSEAELVTGRGYRALEDEATETIALRRRMHEDRPEAYRRRVSALRRAGNRPAVEVSPAERAPFARQLERLRARGIEPIYVIAPWPGGADVARGLVDDETSPTVLAFNDPDAYPEFFELSSRFDANHLTREGAEAFSRVFADRLADALDVRGD